MRPESAEKVRSWSVVVKHEPVLFLQAQAARLSLVTAAASDVHAGPFEYMHACDGM